MIFLRDRKGKENLDKLFLRYICNRNFYLNDVNNIFKLIRNWWEISV